LETPLDVVCQPCKHRPPSYEDDHQNCRHFFERVQRGVCKEKMIFQSLAGQGLKILLKEKLLGVR
jgi:hypothetical protein